MKPETLNFDPEKYTSMQLCMMRNERNAAQVDAEIDRRMAVIARNLKPRRKLKYKMIDYDSQKDD